MRYGAPRVAAQLEREGTQANEKTVAASMRRQGLEGVSPRRFRPVTTIPGRASYHIPDLVNCKWDQGRINAVWITDITYLHTRDGFVYLCAIRDGHSRRVLGWAMDERQTTDLVERASRMAHTLRQLLPTDVGLHADRGSQFTSAQMHQVAVELHVRQSMGRTGVCWDNAMSESFWSTLKAEFYDRRVWHTRAEARREVARWIEIVYNRRRLHTALGMVPPVEFEQALQQKTTTKNHSRKQREIDHVSTTCGEPHDGPARLLRPPAFPVGAAIEREYQRADPRYLPKGTELTSHQPYLDSIADELNDRPRAVLGFYTPREVFTKLLNDNVA